MPKFKIYAGLAGTFGGAHFCGIYDCEDENEARDIAREEALSSYESYCGHHGLYTWDSMRQEIADTEYDGDIEKVDPEDVDIAMAEEVENWLSYQIIPVVNNLPDDWFEDNDDDYNDDDADCYCE